MVKISDMLDSEGCIKEMLDAAAKTADRLTNRKHILVFYDPETGPTSETIEALNELLANLVPAYKLVKVEE